MLSTIAINWRVCFDLLFCAFGVYLTLFAYGWLPSPWQTDDEDPRKIAMLNRWKFLGPLTAILGLLQFLLDPRW